ncbi:hypothetical protein [Sinorhizobium meliloti]|uniref:hypothetical protein n=1 Tax=Rhizobium meliloti TaxID=382 RepID=UPI000FDA8FC7|nr:hypothetical protein [Sinorhizobium meliloti]RVO61804.1 hypothetical protein CN092_01855 [Sinorhizobium meliloti]
MFEDRVERKLTEILSAKIPPEEMPGSTTESAALALILGHPEGLTSLSRLNCWEYLQPQNVVTVHRLISEHSDEIRAWERRRAG